VVALARVISLEEEFFDLRDSLSVNERFECLPDVLLMLHKPG